MKLNNDIFQDWLSARKITNAVRDEFNLYLSSSIVIPVYDADGLFSFNKYRRSPLWDIGPKYWYDRNGKLTLYGWHKAKEHKTILITEGEFDCLVAWSHNIPAVTSTGGAQSFQKEWGELFKDKEVILCFDNDEAGGQGMARTLDIIPHAKIVFIPEGANVKDISDYVMANGNLENLLKTAVYFPSLVEVEKDRIERIAKFQKVFFHDAYIKVYKKLPPLTTKKVQWTGDDISIARQYPIDDMIEFVNKKALCPFHNEKTPSLVHYPETNTCYCFGGCGKAYDAIDIYMKQNNCAFTVAVKHLKSSL